MKKYREPSKTYLANQERMKKTREDRHRKAEVRNEVKYNKRHDIIRTLLIDILIAQAKHDEGRYHMWRGAGLNRYDLAQKVKAQGNNASEKVVTAVVEKMVMEGIVERNWTYYLMYTIRPDMLTQCEKFLLI